MSSASIRIMLLGRSEVDSGGNRVESPSEYTLREEGEEREEESGKRAESRREQTNGK